MGGAELAQRIWTIPKARTKNAKAHIVHLSRQALTVLKHADQRGPLVFSLLGTKRFQDFTHAKRRLDQLSGVTGWRLHDLRRTCVSGMARLGVAPHVADKILDRLMDYRRQCGMRADGAFRRLMARAWNSNIGVVGGWPARRLVEPPAKKQVELVWESFPEGLRWGVHGYLESLTRIRRSQTGRRIRPLGRHQHTPCGTPSRRPHGSEFGRAS